MSCIGHKMSSQPKSMLCTVFNIGSRLPTAAKICPTKQIYYPTIRFRMGSLFYASNPEQTRSVKVFRKCNGSRIPDRLVGIKNHAQYVSH